jgi:hypothetical protein
MDIDNNWVSILEYARLKGISISTIRRHIKAGRIKSQQIKGKYFLRLPASLQGVERPSEVNVSESPLERNSTILSLQQENRQLREEIADLKMLVQILESNQARASMSDRSTFSAPPEIPSTLS